MNARWISLPFSILVTITAGLLLSTPVRVTHAVQDSAETLAQKTGCFECHSVKKNLVGPAYHNIAVRYKNTPDARKFLIEKVKNGGKGNWTSVTHGVPMPPHERRLKIEEIELLVDWVLSR